MKLRTPTLTPNPTAFETTAFETMASETTASETEALIQAVFEDQPTPNGPEVLAHAAPARRGPGKGSMVGAFAATTAGKIILCTAMAAASVGGAYTTGALRPAPVEPPVTSEPDQGVTDAPAAEDGTPLPTHTAPEETIDESVTDDPQVVSPSSDDTTSADPAVGCEHGQATAEAASADATDQRQNPERPVDPCDRSHADPDPTGNGPGNGGNGNPGNGNTGNNGGNNGNGPGNGRGGR